MKVLYLVTAYARDPADVITPWLVETIRRLRARGVDVEVLAPAYRGLATQTVAGVRVHRFRYAPRAWETLTHDQTAPDRIRERPWFLGLVPGYVAAGSRAAAKLAKEGGFEVLHAFWPIPQGLLGVWAKRRSGLPLVSTFFGVELTWMERQFPFLAPLLRRIVRGSDAVTAISTYTADRLRKQVPGVDPAIIPFGAAVDAPAEPPPYAYDGTGDFELLFVGRLVERKGVHLLIDALAALPASRSVRLHVVGDGPDRAALQLLLGDEAVEDGAGAQAEPPRLLLQLRAVGPIADDVEDGAALRRERAERVEEQVHALPLHQPADEEELEISRAVVRVRRRLGGRVHGGAEGDDGGRHAGNLPAEPAGRVGGDRRHRVGPAHDAAQERGKEGELPLHPGQLHPEEGGDQRKPGAPLRPQPQQPLRDRPEGVQDVESPLLRHPGGGAGAGGHVAGNEPQEPRPLADAVGRRLVVRERLP
ncbi:MAG TPA: glycosyltransferase, partial [Longimicrobiaceae bacterium]